MIGHIVKEQYDRLAEKYDQRWQGYILSTLKCIISSIELDGSETILDIACGTGELERLIISRHPNQKITGIDISIKMLDVARRKSEAYKNVNYIQAQASKLPFRNNSFDIIVSANSFHYFLNPQAAVGEMSRVAKQYGRVIIMDWCRDYLLCNIYDKFLKLYDPSHRVCYTQKECRLFFERVKLYVASQRRIRLRFFWGMMITSGVKY
jgi:ubiquinone/menaquinone biosynthesis C-methylase UbiE